MPNERGFLIIVSIGLPATAGDTIELRPKSHHHLTTEEVPTQTVSRSQSWIGFLESRFITTAFQSLGNILSLWKWNEHRLWLPIRSRAISRHKEAKILTGTGRTLQTFEDTVGAIVHVYKEHLELPGKHWSKIPKDLLNVRQRNWNVSIPQRGQNWINNMQTNYSIEYNLTNHYGHLLCAWHWVGSAEDQR